MSKCALSAITLASWKFDSDDRLHAEGKPTIQFADGYSLYSYHGVMLPAQYGKVHTHQWQSEWLLTEDNGELRRVLIQCPSTGHIHALRVPPAMTTVREAIRWVN